MRITRRFSEDIKSRVHHFDFVEEGRRKIFVQIYVLCYISSAKFVLPLSYTFFKIPEISKQVNIFFILFNRAISFTFPSTPPLPPP